MTGEPQDGTSVLVRIGRALAASSPPHAGKGGEAVCPPEGQPLWALALRSPRPQAAGLQCRENAGSLFKPPSLWCPGQQQVPRH